MPNIFDKIREGLNSLGSNREEKPEIEERKKAINDISNDLFQIRAEDIPQMETPDEESFPGLSEEMEKISRGKMTPAPTQFEEVKKRTEQQKIQDLVTEVRKDEPDFPSLPNANLTSTGRVELDEGMGVGEAIGTPGGLPSRLFATEPIGEISREGDITEKTITEEEAEEDEKQIQADLPEELLTGGVTTRAFPERAKPGVFGTTITALGHNITNIAKAPFQVAQMVTEPPETFAEYLEKEQEKRGQTLPPKERQRIKEQFIEEKGLTSKAVANMMPKGSFEQKFYDTISKPVNEFSKKVVNNLTEEQQQAARTIFDEDPGLSSVNEYAFTITSGGLSLAEAITIGAITKNTNAAAGFLSSIEGLDSYQKSLEAGKSPQEAFRNTATTIAGTFVLEKIGLDYLFGATASSRLARAVKVGTFETVQEETQTVWQNLVNKYGVNKSQKIFEGWYETGVATAIPSFILGASMPGVSVSTQGEIVESIQQEADVEQETAQRVWEQMQGAVSGLQGALYNNVLQRIPGRGTPIGLSIKEVGEEGVEPEISPELEPLVEEAKRRGFTDANQQANIADVKDELNKEIQDLREEMTDLFEKGRARATREQTPRQALTKKESERFDEISKKIDENLDILQGRRGEAPVEIKTAETVEKPKTIYKGIGSEMPNINRMAYGSHYAESRNLASQYGKVVEETIPSGAKVVDLDAVKEQFAKEKELARPEDLTQRFIDEGYEWAKGTMPDGQVEYVKLEGERTDWEQSSDWLPGEPIATRGEYAVMDELKNGEPTGKYMLAREDEGKVAGPFDSITEAQLQAEKTLGAEAPTKRPPSAERVLGKEPAPFVRKRETTLLKERIKNLGRGFREGHRFTKQEITNVQNKAINILEEANLPAKDFKKFKRTIKNIQSQEQLEKVKPDLVERVTKLKEAQRVRQLKSAIKKELKTITPRREEGGLRRGKFTPEVQDKLLRIKANLEGNRSESLEKINQNLEKYSKADDNGQLPIVPEEVKEENEFLDMVGIKDMTADKLENTYRNIRSLKEQGQLIRVIQRSNKQAELERVADNGAEEVLQESKVEGFEKERGIIPRVFDQVVNTMLGYEDIVRKMVLKPSKSNLVKWVVNNVHEARKNFTSGNRQLNNLKAIGFQEAVGINKKRKLKRLGKELQKEKIIYKGQDANGKKISINITELEALSHRARIRRLEDMGLETSEILLQLRNKDGNLIEANVNEDIKNALENNIRPELKNYDEFIVNEYLPLVRKIINERYSTKFGLNMAREENYFPIRRSDFDPKDETDLTLGDVFNVNPSAIPSSVREFKGSKKAVALDDYFSVLHRHTQQAMHFTYFDEVVNDMRKVFNDDELRARIKEIHGKGLVKRMDEKINDIALGGTDSRMRVKGIDYLIRNYTKGSLMFNPVPFLKQVTSYPAFLLEDDLATADLFTGTVEFFTNPIKYTRMLTQSETVISRITKGFNRETALAFRKGNWDAQVNETNLTIKQFIQQALVTPTRGGDMVPILPGATAVYIRTQKQLRKEGELSEEQIHERALKDAERSILRTQQSPFIEDQTHWQTANSFFKAASMYSTTPSQYFRLGMEAIRQLKRTHVTRRGEFTRKEKIAETRRSIRKLIVAWVVLPQLFQFVANGFRWDEDDVKRTFALAPFGLAYYPMIGDILETIYDVGQGVGWKDMASAISPLFDIPKKGKQTVQDIQKVIKSYGKEEDYKQDVFDMVETIGVLASETTGKIPSYGFWRTAQGTWDLAAGRTKDPRRLMYSSYALDQGEQAIGNPDEKLSEEEATEWVQKLADELEMGNITSEQYTRRLENFRDKQSRIRAEEVYEELDSMNNKEAKELYEKQPERIREQIDKISEEQSEFEAKQIFKEVEELSFEESKEIYENQSPLVQEELDKLQEMENERQDILDRLGRGYNPQDAKKNSEKKFLKQVANYAEAFSIDPQEAFEKLFTGELVQKTEQDAIIVFRMPFEESQAYRELIEAGDSIEVDHIVPRWLGGTNEYTNLKPVNEDTHSKWTSVGSFLRKYHRNGDISQKKAKELIVDMKNGKKSPNEILKMKF